MVTDPEVDDLTQDQSDDSSVIRELRAKLRASRQENKDQAAQLETLTPQVRKSVLAGLGVAEGSPEHRVLSKHHEGEWTEEAVRATAEEYGYKLGDAARATEPPDPPATEVEQAREQSYDRSAALTAVATPVSPQTLDQQIADAEAKGDTAASVALKQQLLSAGRS